MSIVTSLNRVLSLDWPVSDESNDTFAGAVFDDQAESPLDKVYQKEMRAIVVDLLTTLPVREWSILLDRFGFDGQEPLTLEEVGHKWGISKERIRQLERDALGKLRSTFCATRLPKELFGKAPRKHGLAASKMFRGGNGKMPKRSTR